MLDYADEVRRLLDAALEVMQRSGPDLAARVADIVAAAGLSNDAFYRHFPSKDALVAAVLEDGTERLTSYLAHQMAKQPTPEGQVRRWVEGIMSQAAPKSPSPCSRCCSTRAAPAAGRRTRPVRRSPRCCTSRSPSSAAPPPNSTRPSRRRRDRPAHRPAVAAHAADAHRGARAVELALRVAGTLPPGAARR